MSICKLPLKKTITRTVFYFYHKYWVWSVLNSVVLSVLLPVLHQLLESWNVNSFRLFSRNVVYLLCLCILTLIVRACAVIIKLFFVTIASFKFDILTFLWITMDDHVVSAHDIHSCLKLENGDDGDSSSRFVEHNVGKFSFALYRINYTLYLRLFLGIFR